MLNVDLKTSNELVSGQKEVNIRILLNIPQMNADIFTGFVFSNAPKHELSELRTSFANMKNIMKIHDLKNWQEVVLFLEKMYTDYFNSISNFTLFVRINKVEDIGSRTKEASIKVFMSTPQLIVSEEHGFCFGETPNATVASISIPFSDMKKVMNRHKVHDWKEAKKCLEQKYNQFFDQIFHEKFKELV